MPTNVADVFDSDLPMVRREFPWPIRVGCVAAGAFAIGMTLWELGGGLWPLNIATPFFAIIIGGAGYVGVQFMRAAGCYGSKAYAERVRRVLVVHLGL